MGYDHRKHKTKKDEALDAAKVREWMKKNKVKKGELSLVQGSKDYYKFPFFRTGGRI